MQFTVTPQYLQSLNNDLDTITLNIISWSVGQSMQPGMQKENETVTCRIL